MVSWNAWKHRLCIALVLGMASMQAAIAGPVVSIDATPNPAILGATVDLAVSVTDIADLYAYQFTLSFDPALLQAMGGTEGAFLGSGGSTFFDGGTIDNNLGTISFAFDSLLGNVAGVSGSGNLGHFSFNVIGVGASVLGLSDVLFLDSNFGDLAPQVQGMTLQTSAVPEPSALWLFGLGLAGVALLRRRRMH